MNFAPDGRLFLCEKHGLLRVITNGQMLPMPALDISQQIECWNERGLLSVCFDPQFAKNGWIYVFYTHLRNREDTSHTSSNNRVSRFTLNGDVAVPGSEVVIFEIDNLSKIGWHNGGGLAFGQDGKLYFCTGENATGPNAQKTDNLLGKLLRINKDGTIPNDNPNYEKFTGNNRAIVALGLRNPFTIDIQPGTGLLYLSMVGANFEQIERYDTSAAPVAVNYGWPDIDGPPRDQKLPENYRAPEYAYDHGKGKGLALCGGDFYNPSKPGVGAFPAAFIGKFFFCDYGGWIKSIDPMKPSERQDFATGINRPLDIATAADGSLWYIERAGIPGGSDAANSASTDGALYKIYWTGENVAGKDVPKPASKANPIPGIAMPATADGTMPATLMGTGIFTHVSQTMLTPKAGVTPYTLNSTAWADGATVQRWVALPPAGKIGFTRSGEYQWPGGAILVQHFEMENLANPEGAERPGSDIIPSNASSSEPAAPTPRSLRKRIETRVLVLDESGVFGYGVSYRWRADGTDADLVDEAGKEEILPLPAASGGARQQTWSYPARGLCYLCHTPNAGFVLGPKSHQLSGPDASHNQLQTWSKLQMFKQPLVAADLKDLPRTVKIDDASASLEHRVRSYLDVNCAQCHRPAGTGATWDARFGTELAKQEIIDGPVRNNLGIEGAKIIAPGNMEKSLMHHRLASTQPAVQMPMLTRNVPDTEAMSVLEKWIKSLPPAAVPAPAEIK
jgi:uncharacterized repeat protein (TIGR03806 family)